MRRTKHVTVPYPVHVERWNNIRVGVFCLQRQPAALVAADRIAHHVLVVQDGRFPVDHAEEIRLALACCQQIDGER